MMKMKMSSGCHDLGASLGWSLAGRIFSYVLNLQGYFRTLEQNLGTTTKEQEITTKDNTQCWLSVSSFTEVNVR
ncbi:hypothetical protein K1719_009065 [Acacia pycnantha]|nr:hypothetical protein K1719_009065 [Acacia pycnantha]